MTTPTAGPSRVVWGLYAPALALPPFGDLDPAARAAALPAWICPAIISTPSAEARLRRWVAAGGLSAPDTPAARLAIAEDVELVADEALRGTTLQALVRLPPPVLEHLRANALLITLGVTVRGWCTPVRARAERTEAPFVLVVEFRPGAAPSPLSTAEEFAGVVAHEAAHAWLEPGVALDAPPLSRELRLEAEDNHVQLLACAVEWKMTAQLADRAEEPERLAGALARAWGFTGPAADGDGCAKAARARIERQAAATHATHRGRLFGTELARVAQGRRLS